VTLKVEAFNASHSKNNAMLFKFCMIFSLPYCYT